MTLETAVAVAGAIGSITVCVFGVGVVWGMTKIRLASMSKRVDNLEAAEGSHLTEKDIREVRVRVTALEGDIGPLRQDIATIKADTGAMKTLLQDVRDRIRDQR